MIEQRERKIYLKEMVIDILAKWKSLLIGALIVAVIFAGLKYSMDINDYEAQKNSVAEKINPDSFSYEERKVVDNYVYMQNRINNYVEYSEKSYLMQLDSMNVTKLNMQFFVDSDYVFSYTDENEADYTDALVSMYSQYFTSADFIKTIAEEIDTVYMQELITVLPDMDGDVVNVTVIIPSEMDADAVYNNIVKAVEAKSANLQEYGSHEIINVSNSKTTGFDDIVDTKKYTVNKSISELRAQILLLKPKLTEKQSMYIAQVYGEEVKNQDAMKPSISVKNAVIGFVLGAILMAFYYVVASILSGKLQHWEDIRTMYGVNVLGKLYLAKKSSQKNTETYEKDIAYIVSRIKVLCQNNDIKKVYIAGSRMPKVDEKVMNHIVTSLKDILDEVAFGSDISTDAAALEKAKNMDNIIIIEKIGASHYDDIAEELQIITENDINILGAIVVK